MSYKEKNVAYALNSYVTKLLEANLDWKKYQGLSRIIPSSQQPELMQSGKPFIVYGYSTHPPGHLYQLERAAISYMVYSTSPTEVNTIISLMNETFRRQDEAAVDVNDWLTTEAAVRAGGHRGVYFSMVKTTVAERAEEAAEEEGGYSVGHILLEALYTTDDNTSFQTTGFVN